MDNKNRDDITKSLERTKLAKNYSIEKGFDYLDKTAKKVSNLKTDLLDDIMNDEKNNALFARYKELADKQDKVIFGGRLGMYKYFDMHQVIEVALECAKKELG